MAHNRVAGLDGVRPEQEVVGKCPWSQNSGGNATRGDFFLDRQMMERAWGGAVVFMRHRRRQRGEHDDLLHIELVGLA